MLNRSLPMLSVMVVLATSAYAQNVQTNNQGVIINVVTPAYPVQTDGEALREVLDHNAQQNQAFAERLASESKLQMEREGQRINLEPRSTPAAPAHPLFSFGMVTTDVVLRSRDNIQSAQVYLIPNGGSIKVDTRRGGVLPDWSGVSYTVTTNFGPLVKSGFVQTKYLKTW